MTKHPENGMENDILKMTASIWDTFSKLNQTHPADKEDMARAIHDIQKIIAVRMARRTNPETFITHK